MFRYITCEFNNTLSRKCSNLPQLPMKKEFRSRRIKHVKCPSEVPHQLLFYCGYYLLGVRSLVSRHGNLISRSIWFRTLWLEVSRWFFKFQLWLCVCAWPSHSAPGVSVYLFHLCFCESRRKGRALSSWGWQDLKPNQHCYWAEGKWNNSVFQRRCVEGLPLMWLAWKRLFLLWPVGLKSDTYL